MAVGNRGPISANKRVELGDLGFFQLNLGKGISRVIEEGEKQLENLPGEFPWKNPDSNENMKSEISRPQFAPPTLSELKQAASQTAQGNTGAAVNLISEPVINVAGISLSLGQALLIAAAAGYIVVQ